MAKRKRKKTLGNELAALDDSPTASGESQELTDGEVVSIFSEMHTEAENAYKPIQSISDIAWDAYNNAFDFSDKGDHQSASFLPLYKQAIRVAKSIVRRTLLNAPRYFAVEGMNKESKELEKDVYDTLDRALEQALFKNHVADSAFAGFLENLAVLKQFPAPLLESDDIIHPDQTVKLVFEPVSVPNDFRLDPKGRNLYVLHRAEMDFADFELLVDEGEYTRESLDMARADFVVQEEKYRRESNEGMSDSAKPPWRKTVELWEVWTRALTRADGSAWKRNVMFTVLNRQHLARRPQDYLYRHAKPPFIWSPIADKPFSVYHENFGEPVLGMLDSIIDLLNSLTDAAQNVAVKGFEISMDQIRNPGEVSRGIYGGKVIKSSTPPIPGLQAVRPFDVGEFSPEAFQFLNWMVQQFQNGMGITELLSGISGLGEKTATEVTQKTRAAMSNINEVAGLIDMHLIGPSIRMAYENLLEWNPEVFGDKLAFQTSREKLKFRFKISGISGALKKEGEVQELMMLTKLFMGTPLATQLNWPNIAEDAFSSKGLDPERYLLEKQVQPPEVGEGPTATDDQASAIQTNALAAALGGG